MSRTSEKVFLTYNYHHVLTRTVHVVYGTSLQVDSTQLHAVRAQSWSTSRFYAVEYAWVALTKHQRHDVCLLSLTMLSICCKVLVTAGVP